jgi:hypothetical protein
MGVVVVIVQLEARAPGATLAPSAVQPFAFEFEAQPAATKLDVTCTTELDVAACMHVR